MSNNNPPTSSQRTAATQSLSPGLTSAMLTQINSLSIKLGEAASPFLSIEALMRLLAELHSPYQGQVLELIKNAKTKPKFKEYWDCDPFFLVESIDIIFASELSREERDLIKKYPLLRGKFLHGNYIRLMEALGIEPSSRMMSIQEGQLKKNRLQPGEIKEAFISMDHNHVFEKLRTYSATVTSILSKLIQSLAE